MEKQLIDALLEKYWAGESSLEEEQSLRTYFSKGNISEEHKEVSALFDFFNTERDVVASKAVKELLPTSEISTPQAKIRHFNWTRIAASVMLVFTMLVGWNYLSSPQVSNSTAVEEIQDPEEAYRVTMEALAYLSNKYDKGAKPLQSISKVNATNILNN